MQNPVFNILYGRHPTKSVFNCTCKCYFNTESRDRPEKIETCYFCNKKFDMNKDDCSHYKYGKFPMCDYCSQFYGFYEED